MNALHFVMLLPTPEYFCRNTLATSAKRGLGCEFVEDTELYLVLLSHSWLCLLGPVPSVWCPLSDTHFPHQNLNRITNHNLVTNVLPYEVCNTENIKNATPPKRMYRHISGIIATGKAKGWSNNGRISGIRQVRKKKIVWALKPSLEAWN